MDKGASSQRGGYCPASVFTRPGRRSRRFPVCGTPGWHAFNAAGFGHSAVTSPGGRHQSTGIIGKTGDPSQPTGGDIGRIGTPRICSTETEPGRSATICTLSLGRGETGAGPNRRDRPPASRGALRWIDPHGARYVGGTAAENFRTTRLNSRSPSWLPAHEARIESYLFFLFGLISELSLPTFLPFSAKIAPVAPL